MAFFFGVDCTLFIVQSDHGILYQVQSNPNLTFEFLAINNQAVEMTLLFFSSNMKSCMKINLDFSLLIRPEFSIRVFFVNLVILVNLLILVKTSQVSEYSK